MPPIPLGNKLAINWACYWPFTRSIHAVSSSYTAHSLISWADSRRGSNTTRLFESGAIIAWWDADKVSVLIIVAIAQIDDASDFCSRICMARAVIARIHIRHEYMYLKTRSPRDRIVRMPIRTPIRHQYFWSWIRTTKILFAHGDFL